jgi:hypothetical protein
MENKAIKLFVDMDGTLATWKLAASMEELLQKNYFRDLPPYQSVVEAIRLIINCKPEVDVYVLSAYMPENETSVDEKGEWLNEFLPEIDNEHRIFVPCGCSKVSFVESLFDCRVDDSFVLLDDYSINLHEWERGNGRGIKLRNGVNGTTGTWVGHEVTRFEAPEHIYRHICDIMLPND